MPASGTLPRPKARGASKRRAPGVVSKTLSTGETVELTGGRLRGTEECPVVGDLKGAKAVVIRSPQAADNPDTGKREDRVVVKPILANGSLGFPIEIACARTKRIDPIIEDVGNTMYTQHESAMAHSYGRPAPPPPQPLTSSQRRRVLSGGWGAGKCRSPLHPRRKGVGAR